MTEAKRNNLTPELFRQKLAGLVDESNSVDACDVIAFEAQAIDLAVAMAEVFGDQLDRVTLWSRIASGLEQSSRENPNAPLSLVNGCLMHVKADPMKTASNERVASVVATVSRCNEVWSRQWARWIINHIHVVVIKARAEWQVIKSERVAK